MKRDPREGGPDAARTRRRFLRSMAWWGLAGTVPLPRASMAQAASTYPTRSIRLVVPYSAASASDLLARVTAEKLSTILGQSVIVDARPGANGVIGTQAAASAAADGYTFVVLNDATAALNPSLLPNLPYNVQRDFVPLSLGGDVRMVLIVNPSVPVRTVADLIALARSKNGQLDYASGGNGSVQQVLMEIFMQGTGVRLTHVPYKGVIPAVNDVIGGSVPVIFAGTAGALPQIKAGRVRAIAVTSATRFAALPDVPTLSEAGVPGFPSEPWNAFFAPVGMPPAILSRLTTALVEALNAPDVKEKLANVISVHSSTPDELSRLLDRDVKRFAKLVQAVGMKAD